MWYAKAAEQDYAEAQSNLGIMYDHGRGISEDNEAAVLWYTKAAQQGYVDAQVNLGFMSANGEGLEKNEANAYLWWSLAKAGGNKLGKINLEELVAVITPQEIERAQAIAATCYESGYKDCN